jgi:hypothetical protein
MAKNPYRPSLRQPDVLVGYNMRVTRTLSYLKRHDSHLFVEASQELDLAEKYIGEVSRRSISAQNRRLYPALDIRYLHDARLMRASSHFFLDSAYINKLTGRLHV